MARASEGSLRRLREWERLHGFAVVKALTNSKEGEAYG